MIIDQRINELFSKYLSGDCSPAEWEELLVLINGIEDTDAATLSEPLRTLWEKAGNKELPSRAHLIDREKMYAAITRPEEEIPPAIPARQWQPWRIAAAAAILGLLITGGIYLAYYKKQTETARNKTPDTNQVRPGANKAILILAGGRQIILDSAGKGLISTQGNTAIINANGRLSYENTKTAPPSSAEISYNTINTARANQYQLVLPDGSKVWLNAVSSLRFPTAFTGKDRTVEMTGEAYFEIAPNVTQPFYVKVNGTTIEVLGTHFNINAYTDEAEQKTSLLEGSVKIMTAGNTMATGNAMIARNTGMVRPGEEASVIPNGSLKIAAGNVNLAIAWKNGYFQFDKAPLPVIMRQIGRWYDLDIKYEGPVPDRVFKGKLQRVLPLSGILNLLQKGGIHFKLEGKSLTVTQ